MNPQYDPLSRMHVINTIMPLKACYTTQIIVKKISLWPLILSFSHQILTDNVFIWLKKNLSVQFKMILSRKVNLYYGNGLAPRYLPILHEGGGWPQAIAKLVAHFHRRNQGGNYVPTNKASRCCSRINKTGQIAAFGYALPGDSETSMKFHKSIDGFADI